MNRFIPPLIVLVPQDSNFNSLRTSLLTVLRVIYSMPLFGLVQTRPWF